MTLSNETAATANASAECSQLMVTMASTMAMQAAVAGIPSFNGSNIPLKDVQNSAADIPDDMINGFLKKVLGKLRGSARTSTYGVTFNNVDDLVKHLKRRFAPGKTFTYYNAQLNADGSGKRFRGGKGRRLCSSYDGSHEGRLHRHIHTRITLHH